MGSASGRDGARARGAGDGYVALSTRPLHILAFLLPLIVLYELGSVLYLTTGESTVKLISAQALLLRVFNIFGLGSVYLPGVLLIVILLIWHVLTRDQWRVKWRVLGLMLAESAIWTLPLLVLGGLVYRLVGGSPHMVAFADADIESLSLPGRAAISIGAGLYEELLFRMVAIALVHLIAADLLRIKDYPARVIAVVLSAIAFGLYHDIATAGGGIDWPRLTVLIFAGLYFGALYVVRGFGIVVGVHALYDLTVLVIFPQSG